MKHSRFSTASGRRITQMLAAACLTQYDLARLLDVSRSTLNQWISGRMVCPFDLEAATRRALMRELEKA